MVEGGDGGGAGRPGDARAAPSADSPGTSRGDEALPAAALFDLVASSQSAGENETADDSIKTSDVVDQPGEADTGRKVTEETAETPRLTVVVAETPLLPPSPQMRSPTARMMDLSSILMPEAVAMDVDQDGEQTTGLKESQTSGQAGGDAQDCTVEPTSAADAGDVPVDREKQAEGVVALNGSTPAASEDRDGGDQTTSPAAESITSAVSLDGVNTSLAGQKQPANGLLEAQNPSGDSAQRAPGRSTRSSRKTAPATAFNTGPAAPIASCRPAMHADLTLEMVSGGDDGSPDALAVPPKKRSQRASAKAAADSATRTTKRPRTLEKPSVGVKEEEEDDDVVFVKNQPAPALPPRSTSRKRRQTAEGPDQFEPSPIIDNPPPLPFTTHSSRRSASHSSSPSRGASVDRECEFCKHAVDLCSLLICKACRRAYHVRCLIKQFKEYWPSEGSMETRLKKLQEAANDRRVSLFRCSSCRAAFAEFVDTDATYLAPCSCPTCARPELLATYRRNKLVQMLDEMSLAKAQKKQGGSSKASVTSDASAGSGSGETKKELASRGGAARRKSSRPVRRGGLEDVSTGLGTAENSPTDATVDLASTGSQVAPTSSESALTALTLVDLKTSQPVPIAATTELTANSVSLPSSKKPSNSRGQAAGDLGQLGLIEFVVHREEKTLRFPFVCLRSRCDGSDTSLRASQSRYFSVRKLTDSITKRGHYLWQPGRPAHIECACCKDVFTLAEFAKHAGLHSADANNVRFYMLAVHRDGMSASKLDPVTRALRNRIKITPKHSFDAAFAPLSQHNSLIPHEVTGQDQVDDVWSNDRIPRKKKPGVDKPAPPKTVKPEPNADRSSQLPDLLNDINAEAEREVRGRQVDASTVKLAVQKVTDSYLTRRNRTLTASKAIVDPTETDADPLDYLLQVVSLPQEYIGVTADGNKMDKKHYVPPGATTRRAGCLALSASRRFSRLIYCDCCDKALPVATFISHGMEPGDKGHLGLYVMEKAPGIVHSFRQFCVNTATIAHAGGDQAFAAILENLHGSKASPAASR